MRVCSASLGVAAALGVVVACMTTIAQAGPQPLTYTSTLAHGQTVVVDATEDLKADIRVSATDQNTVTVSVTSEGRNAESVRLKGDTAAGMLAMHVTATAKRPGGFFDWLSDWRPEATIDVRVPRSATLSVHAINGPITINGVIGPLRVSTVNGPITVAGAGTVLYLATTNGPVEATVTRLTAPPNITISTTNGPIDLLVPTGFRASIHASTVFGPVDNNLTDADGPGSVSLETVNGPVSISTR